eukprot:3686444-Rhodomonas_salina.2
MGWKLRRYDVGRPGKVVGWAAPVRKRRNKHDPVETKAVRLYMSVMSIDVCARWLRCRSMCVHALVALERANGERAAEG